MGGYRFTPFRRATKARETPEFRLGFEPDAVQRRVLESTSRQGILNCCRQWGKSTITAAKAVRLAVEKAKSLVVVVSPCARQSGEFLRKAEEFVRLQGLRVRSDGDNEMSIELTNRSRIVGLPGSEAKVRGFSAVDLLVVDEAARVTDELYLAVRPMLTVSRGAVWLLSTPFGKQGFFWKTWEQGGPEWERIRVTGPECPRIAAEVLARERRALGEAWFVQEYLGQFSEATGYVFRREVVERAIRPEVRPLKL